MDRETSWHCWAIFHHTDRNDATRNTNIFYLAPALTNAFESDLLEEVRMLRDEMANMVWGVEKTVPSQAGRGERDGDGPPRNRAYPVSPSVRLQRSVTCSGPLSRRTGFLSFRFICQGATPISNCSARDCRDRSRPRVYC